MGRSSVLVVLVLVLAGCSAESAAPAATRAPELRSARFAALPAGWHQFDEGVQRIGPCHVVAYTLAANWRADRAGSHGWAAEMPAGAIAITVGLIGRSPGERLREHYPPIARRPLRLPGTTDSALEGAPRVPEYRTFGRTRDYLVDVRADINDAHPSRALVRQAQGVVKRLLLPDWPRPC
ncbi:MAG: hypothetical protein QOE69_281 [Thermoleophilaceae bacterium]|jgi:hypothetical protein|nr:hypothetical protein [Thermoleophilaceae bacterium]